MFRFVFFFAAKTKRQLNISLPFEPGNSDKYVSRPDNESEGLTRRRKMNQEGHGGDFLKFDQ